MTTRADQYRANALHEVGEDYVWGAEGTGGVDGDDDYDCSGFYYAMLKDVGVRIGRTTAEGYRKMARRIDKPKLVGADFAVFIHERRATHIIPYIGRGDTVEAKGKAYGVVASDVAGVNARGGIWYRMPGIYLGELTPTSNATAKPRAYPGRRIKRGDHGTDVRWVQKRLNAHGFKVSVDGVFGDETARAVHAFRLKHFRTRPQGYSVGPSVWRALSK